MNIREELQQIVREAIAQAGLDYHNNISLKASDFPGVDFASPVAMQIDAKNSFDIAKKIVDQIDHTGNLATVTSDDLGVSYHFADDEWILSKIFVPKNGYINFQISELYKKSIIKNILEQGNAWGNNGSLEGKKYLMEHTSVNLFKPFHIGHLLSNVTGESLTRIATANGAHTIAISYPSDKSPGIAKAVWALKELHGDNTHVKLEKRGEKEIVSAMKMIGEAYAYGVAQYQEDEDVQAIVNQINRDIYNNNNSEYFRIYLQGKKLSLQYFQKFSQRLGSTFSGFIFESEAEKEGKRVVEEHAPSVYKKSEGAFIFEGSRYGLFDNVFINRDNFATYLGKDVGLMALKAKEYKDCDQWFYIIDNEQKPHFQLLAKSVEQFEDKWVNKAEFVYHGRLSLSTGKISSREGGVPMAEDLLDILTEKSYQKINERGVIQGDMIHDLTDKIAQSALKFSVLKVQTGKNIVFDFDKDLSFEGMSGPYVQYAYVRAISAVAQAKKIKQKDIKPYSIEDVFNKNDEQRDEVEKKLFNYDYVVERAWQDKTPHHIAQYVYELASEFNSFYAQTKIADAHNPDLLANIELVEAVAQTLHNGLYLLGIDTVEQM